MTVIIEEDNGEHNKEIVLDEPYHLANDCLVGCTYSYITYTTFESQVINVNYFEIKKEKNHHIEHVKN